MEEGARVVSRETEGEGEAGSPLGREPDAGLDPKSPGSQPGPKVALNS